MQPIEAGILLQGLAEPGQTAGKQISAVVTDSRVICPDCVFVCFPGQRVDGHDFAAQAIRQGAAFVVANHPVEGVPTEQLILCPSSHQAMMTMGANYRRCFNPLMIGVTGSVGKTTTKEFCYAVLSAFGSAMKTEGNQNNEIGVPNTLFRLEDSTRYAVVEMGMSALGEIHRLSCAARPNAGIITCIGVSHLETLGSRENILKAKLELCDGLPEGAPLALNGDDEYLRRAQQQGQLPGHVRPVWFSLEDREADVWASEIEATAQGQHFYLNDRLHGRFEVYIPALGRHSVSDALAAYAAATRLGLDPQVCAQALGQYRSTGMRQNIRQVGGITFVEDCYNASPDSMKASLSMFEQYPCSGRKFALLGDMLELGSLEQQAHRQAGCWAAGAGLKALAAVGPASREMAQQAGEMGLEAHWFEQPEQAACWLLEVLKPGDALLAKASRGIKLEAVLNAVYEPLEDVKKSE